MESPFASLPVPPIPGTEGREHVRIHECGEPLVPVSTLAPARLRVFPEYYLQGFVAAPLDAYVRETVGSMLVKAAESLPAGYRLLVLDGWRPLSLQQELFDMELARQRTIMPDADKESIEKAASVFVSVPSTDAAQPPPHLTGGAVDVKLCDDRHQIVPMGFDDFGPGVATRYFEEKLEASQSLSPDEHRSLEHRRVLYHAMTAAGFSNYRAEWWHYDYGDQFWGRITGRDAIYGPYIRSM